MGIFRESRAVGKMARYLQDHRPDIVWQIDKLPDATPHVIVAVRDDISGWLIPTGSDWQIALGDVAGIFSRDSLGPLRQEPGAVLHQLVRLVTQLRGAGEAPHPATQSAHPNPRRLPRDPPPETVTFVGRSPDTLILWNGRDDVFLVAMRAEERLAGPGSRWFEVDRLQLGATTDVTLARDLAARWWTMGGQNRAGELRRHLDRQLREHT